MMNYIYITGTNLVNKINYFKLLKIGEIRIKNVFIYDLIDLMKNQNILMVKINLFEKMILNLLLEVHQIKEKAKILKIINQK